MVDRREIVQLSVEERLDLVELIWDSIAVDANSLPVSPSQIEVLRTRLAEFNATPSPGTPWAQVRARIEGQL